MKQKFLLPNKFKYVGLGVFLIGIAFGVFAGNEPSWLDCKIIAPILDECRGEILFFQPHTTNLGFTILGFLLIAGGLLIAFSKEKVEDEFINSLRLKAFQYAVLINFVILFLCYILVWECAFINVMCYNMFSTLIFFIVIFHYLLLKTKNLRKNEE